MWCTLFVSALQATSMAVVVVYIDVCCLKNEHAVETPACLVGHVATPLLKI